MGKLATCCCVSLFLGAILWCKPLPASFLKGTGFYVAFELAIQTLGVYLEFAMLVVPALAAASLIGSRQIIMAFTIAAIGLFSGWLASSLFWDIPSGPAIVVMICLVALLSPLLLRLFKKSLMGDI